MQKEEMKEGKKGITLIALVITIIIMLILAGVAINGIVGEGSIIRNAGEVVKQSNIANKKEEIELAIINKTIQSNREIGIEDIIEQLEKEGIIKTGNSNAENGQVKTEPDGYVYKIIDEGNGEWKVEYIGKGEIERTDVTISVSPKATILRGEKIELTEYFEVTANGVAEIKSIVYKDENNIEITNTEELGVRNAYNKMYSK